MNKSIIRIGLVYATDFRGYPPGGAQPTIEIFLKGTQGRSFDIWLFGLSTSPDEPVRQVSKREIYGREYPFVPLFHLHPTRYANRKPLVPFRVRAFLAFIRSQRLIDSLKFDILYLHGPETLPLLWRKRQPVLYHFHGPDEAAAEYSRYAIFRTRIFSHLYGMGILSMLERADQFITIDPETHERYTRRVPQRKDRFHLFPTAIDVDQFRPIDNFDWRAARLRFGLPLGGKMVLFVGRLSWRKGVDLLLRAFSLVAAQVPNAFLAIAGIGEDRSALETLAHELNLDGRVFFLGKVAHLPSPDLPSLFNAADVSVVASLQESLALVITEALACGTPVVSTPVGIAPKVIRDGITGYIVQSREPDEMATRIVQIIQDGKYDAAECVAAAQEYGETSKPICDVIEQACWRNGEQSSGALESRSFERPAALK